MSRIPFVQDHNVVETLVQTGCASTVRITRELHDRYLADTKAEGLPESILSDEEKRKIESLGLHFKGPTYLAPVSCPCGRRLNSYDFLMTGIYHHGVERIRAIFNSDDIIAQINPALDHIICSSSLHKVPFPVPGVAGATSRRYFWTLLYACVETSSITSQPLVNPNDLETRVMFDGIIARLERLEGR